jgi:hypothetical protein
MKVVLTFTVACIALGIFWKPKSNYTFLLPVIGMTILFAIGIYFMDPS